MTCDLIPSRNPIDRIQSEVVAEGDKKWKKLDRPLSQDQAVQHTPPPRFFNIRNLFIFMAFWASGLLFAVRVVLNLGIVAMVKNQRSNQDEASLDSMDNIT